MYLPRSDSGRIIVGTWWLVVLVIVTTYCGNLVAFLTFPKMEASINSVDELVYGNNANTWSIRANTYLEIFLKVSRSLIEFRFFIDDLCMSCSWSMIQETEIEKYMKLNESAETHDGISNVTLGRIRGGKHIIIDWETNLLHVMHREFLETDKCEFTLSKFWAVICVGVFFN